MNHDLPVDSEALAKAAVVRGIGEGVDFKPWVDIYESSSDGKKVRITDSKHGKMHLLCSLGEWELFLNAGLDRSLALRNKQSGGKEIRE